MMAKKRILNGNICGAMVIILATVSNAFAANVVQRNTVSNRVSASRPTAAAARMPTMSVTTTATSTSATPETSAPAQTETTPTTETTAPVIENKSDAFGTGLTSKSETIIDTAAANLAELVRAQRAALDASGAGVPTATQTMNTTGTGENICDTALRECMIQRCGTGFTKCVSDTDTTFFDKMDTCRRTTNCTGREYQLFSVEIKADRDFNAKLANYNATIDCGNNYDKCIIEQCGPTYSKCIGKSAGDTAIAKCENIAKSCTQYDSGLAMRTMGVFADVRQTAERQIAADEKTLYVLRDQMRALCGRLGAMFDERSLDCVYTVNFYAGDNTLFASKKAYAGGTFDCTQNWFGIDVTTFRENAFRETRAQTAASSAMLGSGVGMAVGAITSGAIDRAVARFNADNALDNAIKECLETYGENAPECQKQISERAESSKQGNIGDKLGDVTKVVDDMKSKVESAQQQATSGNDDGAVTPPVATPESPAPAATEESAADDDEVTMSAPVNIDKAQIDNEKTENMYNAILMSSDPIFNIKHNVEVDVDKKYADAIKSFAKDEHWKDSEQQAQIHKNTNAKTVEISFYNNDWTINTDLHNKWLESGSTTNSNVYPNDAMFTVCPNLEKQYCNGLEGCSISYTGRHIGTGEYYYYGCYISVPYSK